MQDDYIQEEILQGFDVTAVFIKRNADYYDFRPEVSSKEMIRTYLQSGNQTLIAQFERWWDKYRVSLHEMDKQVVEAEAVMERYLAEFLRYE